MITIELFVYIPIELFVYIPYIYQAWFLLTLSWKITTFPILDLRSFWSKGKEKDKQERKEVDNKISEPTAPSFLHQEVN